MTLTYLHNQLLSDEHKPCILPPPKVNEWQAALSLCTHTENRKIIYLRPSCFLNAFKDFAIIGATPVLTTGEKKKAHG